MGLQILRVVFFSVEMRNAITFVTHKHMPPSNLDVFLSGPVVHRKDELPIAINARALSCPRQPNSVKV